MDPPQVGVEVLRGDVNRIVDEVNRLTKELSFIQQAESARMLKFDSMLQEADDTMYRVLEAVRSTDSVVENRVRELVQGWSNNVDDLRLELQELAQVVEDLEDEVDAIK
jgi:uncharacterized protein Yka (UPF0111/DUF47 family)